jgi:hypothetical protein
MAQIVLDVDDETYEKIAQSAKRRHYTIPQFIEGNINFVANHDWPDDHFELAGAIKDDDGFLMENGECIITSTQTCAPTI